jgi:hypothetical protein
MNETSIKKPKEKKIKEKDMVAHALYMKYFPSKGEERKANKQAIIDYFENKKKNLSVTEKQNG